MRSSPAAGAALIFGGLAIAGAPPLAVFLSEFAILKAGLTQGQYVATGLLALFIAIAFFGVLVHLNRMVFGGREDEPPPDEHGKDAGGRIRLPLSCTLALVLAAVPVIALGLCVPPPLHHLLSLAAGALTR